MIIKLNYITKISVLRRENSFEVHADYFRSSNTVGGCADSILVIVVISFRPFVR